MLTEETKGPSIIARSFCGMSFCNKWIYIFKTKENVKICLNLNSVISFIF